MRGNIFLRTTTPLPLIVVLLLNLVAAARAQAAEKPVLLYSRYFNAEGENRYTPDTTYKDVLKKLGREFDVQVSAERPTKTALTSVKLLLIANPSDKAVPGHSSPHHFAEADISAISEFIHQGGGLIIMGNQENHNLEVEDTNKLLTRFGIQFTNRYTDAKKLVLPRATPIIGGLRWAYYTGNLLLLDSSHAAKPRCIVSNDLAQKPLKGLRDEPGCLMASAEPGRGRVVVVTDAGWVADFAFSEEGVGGVAITGQDNWEIFRRLARWGAHRD